MVRRSSSFNTARIDHIFGDVELVFGDLTDASSLNQLMRTIRPDEVYNLGAQSHVRVSFDIPEYTADVDALGTLRLLDAIREEGVQSRFYQASSSEMFGRVLEVPQTESTAFHPRSPYGVAKAYGHFLTVNYRESYGLFAVSGILFNHESPRRGLEFVTRKITDGAARIALGISEQLPLGNLEAKRDWGFAGDYVEAMWRMLQQPEPSDYVVASGVAHSVREVVQIAFDRVGLDYERCVVADESLFRPAEVDHLLGDATKARTELGWTARVDFQALIEMMVDADVARHENRLRAIAASRTGSPVGAE
jgi:GDPmannose 4,6-dehydratase